MRGLLFKWKDATLTNGTVDEIVKEMKGLDMDVGVNKRLYADDFGARIFARKNNKHQFATFDIFISLKHGSGQLEVRVAYDYANLISTTIIHPSVIMPEIEIPALRIVEFLKLLAKFMDKMDEVFDYIYSTVTKKPKAAMSELFVTTLSHVIGRSYVSFGEFSVELEYELTYDRFKVLDYKVAFSTMWGDEHARERFEEIVTLLEVSE